MKSSGDQMDERLYGAPGWKEFLQNRAKLLSDFDRAKGLGSSQAVQTEHGRVAEASIRKWLADFLPARYGVTSGFIVPRSFAEIELLRHYDVIIFDKLSAPVLWASDSADQSEQGRHRAIPAQYVNAVFEVKSSFTHTSVGDAAKKLNELNSLRSDLMDKFSCGVIFFDLHEDQTRKMTLMATLSGAASAPGFWGGTILRTDCDDLMAGLIVMGNAGDNPVEGFSRERLVKPEAEIGIYVSKHSGQVTVEPGETLRATLFKGQWLSTKVFQVDYTFGSSILHFLWSCSGFSEFASALLNRLEGIPYFSNAPNRHFFAQVFSKMDVR